MPSENGSPVVLPDVPIGPATQVGTGLGVLAAFVGAAFAFAHGDHTEETVTSLIIGGVLIASVIWGRMLQAIAQIKAAQPRIVALSAPITGELSSGGDTPLSEEAMADHDRDIEGDSYDRPFDPEAEAREIEEAQA